MFGAEARVVVASAPERLQGLMRPVNMVVFQSNQLSKEVLETIQGIAVAGSRILLLTEVDELLLPR